MSGGTGDSPALDIVGLRFVSLYYDDIEGATAYFARVFGPPAYVEAEGAIRGWPMGDTWLTLFTSDQGLHAGSDPRGTEFAVHVATPAAVDRLYDRLIDAGGAPCMAPRDTEMYVPMRFAAVDTPHGPRIDVYCPIDAPPAP